MKFSLKFNKLINDFYFLFKFVILFNLNILLLIILKKYKEEGKRIGVVGVRHESNVGNNLIKYAISIKLKELGYKPYIIGTHLENRNIAFINQTTNLIIIHNNFSEIKKDDYDFLMVNSDQTWRKFDSNFYDYAFLKFAENWKIKKFVYGASVGFDEWNLSLEDDKVAKKLLRNFNGISVREEGSIRLIEKHFGIKPEFVLDPTLLIDKKYYLKIIQKYKGFKIMKKKYIFIYNIMINNYILNAVKNASSLLNYEPFYFTLNKNTSIEDFLYYIFKSNAVITDSFHGTIFSIIFNKPFITIYDKLNAKERFISLGNLFGIHDRLFENGQQINFSQLIKPINIDDKLLNQLKLKSINFIKNNLKK